MILFALHCFLIFVIQLSHCLWNVLYGLCLLHCFSYFILSPNNKVGLWINQKPCLQDQIAANIYCRADVLYTVSHTTTVTTQESFRLCLFLALSCSCPSVLLWEPFSPCSQHNSLTPYSLWEWNYKFMQFTHHFYSPVTISCCSWTQSSLLTQILYLLPPGKQCRGLNYAVIPPCLVNSSMYHLASI